MQADNKIRALTLVLLLTLMTAALGMLTLINLEPVVTDALMNSVYPPPTVAPSPIPTTAPEATPVPTPVPTPEPTPQPVPELLTLVNPWNEMEQGYVPELTQVTWDQEENQFIDSRCAEELLQMISDCKAAGNEPYICSGYRTMEKQKYLFNNKLARLVDEGMDPGEAPAVAAMSVAIPGTSEHQLGLAVDIIDLNYPYLNANQENMPTQKWLMENSWKYGFILRYPSEKSDITGIIYEPWHYRYVGREYAQEIYELGVTLEEYLELRYPQSE